MLNKFRDHKALAKKISRSLGRGEVGDAARLEKTHTPKLTLDHIIKERYPTFVDALRDLDDALSLIFLFANLPSTSTVPPKTIALCQRLCLEFQHYLITTNSLRKSFLSIKGIYYQATIQGQDILWLVPYKFVQKITGEVDFRIMGTFVEFYTTLLGFVNFRLYTSIGLVYPPKFNKASDDQGAELGALTLEGKRLGEAQQQEEKSQAITNGTTDDAAVQAPVDATGTMDLEDPEQAAQDAEKEQDGEDERNEAIDTFEATGPDADILPQPQISSTDASTLFAPFTFFLSRETPRQPLEFLLRAFGCKRVGWDAVLGEGAFTTDLSDSRITHQIVDRPMIPLPDMPEPAEDGAVRPSAGQRVPGRTYIQPQWVWDCVNEGRLLRPDLYAPGATLPPHLSPWVKPTRGAYDPTAPLAEQEREGEAEMAEEEREEEDENEDEVDGIEGEDEADKDVEAADSDEEDIDGGMTVALAEKDEDDSEASEDDEFGGFEDDDAALSEDEAEDERSQHQKELEAEAAGLPYSAIDSTESKGKSAERSAKQKKLAVKKRQEEEELERQKMMMPRRKRKVLDKMLYSNKKKDEEAEKLRGKRRKLEARKGKDVLA